jgi:hypothetical protein
MPRGTRCIMMGLLVVLLPEWGWSAVVLRLKMKDKCRWIVPVRMKEQGEYDFLVDTGATSTVVDAKLAAKLGLQQKGSALSGTYVGKVEVPIVWLENLSVGPRSHVGLEVISVDLGRFFGLDGSIRGILGQDVLSRFNYHIDHRARNFVIEEEGDPEFGPAGARIPFERRGGKPYIEVTVPGVRQATLRVMLDSGIPYPVIYADAASRLDLRKPIHGSDRVAAQSGLGRRDLFSRVLDRLNVGNLELKNLTLYVTPRNEMGKPEDGILPLSLFDSVYVNNTYSFVVFYPQHGKKR